MNFFRQRENMWIKYILQKFQGQFGENEIARFKEGLDIGNGERSKQTRLRILKADVQESRGSDPRSWKGNFIR